MWSKIICHKITQAQSVFSVANFSFWQLSRITTIWFTIVSCIVIHANCQKFRYWLEQPHVDSHKHKSSLWIISLWFLTIIRMKKLPHWKHTAVFLQGRGHCESNSYDSWWLSFNRIICYKPVNKQKHNHMLTHTSTRPCEFRKQMFIVNHIVVILDDRQNEKFATLKTHGPLWIK